MTVARTVAELRNYLRSHTDIGFVPTMGAFHEGHLELMRQCRNRHRTTVVSLFVNPLQFGPNEDFNRYPRDEERDFRLAEGVGVDVIFAPDAGHLTEGVQTSVHVAEVGDLFEGAQRPGHFDGVATIVLKLFNIVQPQSAYFGLKDLQQCAVVKRMVNDLNLPVEIQTAETVRTAEGLALSSRNQYLCESEQKTAPLFNATLRKCASSISQEPHEVEKALATCKNVLTTNGFDVEYVELVDVDSMKPTRVPSAITRVVSAVRLGKVRLLDNVPL